jgi:hypothetical protein
MPIINNNNNPTVVVTEQVNKIVVNTPGPQGPRGKTILNGNGAPADNLGFEGDFYYDKNNYIDFMVLKLNDAILGWSNGKLLT